MKQKKVTECVLGSERYERAKNAQLMLKCTCAKCGITQSKFFKGKLNGLSERAGGSLFDVHSCHSVGEALLKSGPHAALLLGRQGLSKVISSDFPKKKKN